MLEELYKNHNQFVNYAFSLCKCHDTAKDLVQDAYIKIIDKKNINNSYFLLTIKSIFLDSKRKNKIIVTPFLDEKINIEDTNEIDLKIEKEENIEIIAECIGYLKTHEKLIITYSYRDGLREFSRESGISVGYIQKVRAKLKTLIWQRKKELEELETLSNEQLKQLELNLATIAIKEKIS